MHFFLYYIATPTELLHFWVGKYNAKFRVEQNVHRITGEVCEQQNK